MPIPESRKGRFSRLSLPRTVGITLAIFGLAASAPAAINYPVSFNDPGGTYSAYYPAITSNLQAAGARWSKYLAASGSIEIEVEFTTAISGIDGASFTSGFVRNDGTRDIYEQGAAYELRTGTDPNGASPDVHIRINPNYLASTVWLDPNPSARTDPIPANHLDGLSLFIHELGHAYAFSAFINGTTGQLPPTFMSTFDEHTQFDGTNFYFVGAKAMAQHGGPVPLTYNNTGHLGNNSPRPGADLIPDLMNGVVYFYQMRYDISSLDLAIVRDCGLALVGPGQLLNISTRLRVQTGENALIGGFIITGTQSKKVIVRAIGPSLAPSFPNALSDPTLELFQGSTLLASNDNWKDTQQTEIEATGIPPANTLESAIVRTLAPGSYTAIVRGKASTTGIGVVEAYDLDQAADSTLANISTRGFVDIDDKVMIGGLIVGPVSGTSAKVVVRAIGPSLSNSGIAGALQDPTLDLVNSNGVIVRSNNNWKDSQQAEITATGIPPNGDRESAIVELLAPGNYTAIVRGSGNTTGVGLVEVYHISSP